MLSLLQRLDSAALAAMVAMRTDTLTAAMRAITLLGEWYVVLPAAALIVFHLSRRRLARDASALALAVGGTATAVVVLKELIARPRPPASLQLVHELGYSFPSWHAAIAAAFWGWLAIAALRHINRGAGCALAVSGCALLVLAIGFSRLYLGAHYLSDVIGGFLLGTLALWLAMKLSPRSIKGS